LFNDESAKREIKSINSEHKKNVGDDNWRLSQIDKDTADPKHPYHHFGTGKPLNC